MSQPERWEAGQPVRGTAVPYAFTVESNTGTVNANSNTPGPGVLRARDSWHQWAVDMPICTSRPRGGIEVVVDDRTCCTEHKANSARWMADEVGGRCLVRDVAAGPWRPIDAEPGVLPEPPAGVPDRADRQTCEGLSAAREMEQALREALDACDRGATAAEIREVICRTLEIHGERETDA